MSHPHQLDIPPIAAGELNAVELVRAWVAADDLHVSINPQVWSDPGTWGILARHLARAYAQSDGLDEQETLGRIKQLFDAEWSHATDAPRGGLVEH